MQRNSEPIETEEIRVLPTGRRCRGAKRKLIAVKMMQRKRRCEKNKEDEGGRECKNQHRTGCRKDERKSAVGNILICFVASSHQTQNFEQCLFYCCELNRRIGLEDNSCKIKYACMYESMNVYISPPGSHTLKLLDDSN